MKIPAKDFKFGTYGVVDLKPCKARTKLLALCKEMACKGTEFKPIELLIEAELDGGIKITDFDSLGQDFTIRVKRVQVKS